MATDEMQIVHVEGEIFRVPASYTAVGLLGSGTYGVVAEFTDKSGRGLAVKKVFGVFSGEGEDLAEAKRCLREIKLLRHFKHENVIELIDVLPPPSPSFEDIYFVIGLMETDLHHVIQSSQDLTDDHVLFFSYQILRGLKYLHSARVVHRDLKPRNLLVNSSCDLQICDFGLSRVIAKDLDGTQRPVTEEKGLSSDKDSPLGVSIADRALSNGRRGSARPKLRRCLTAHNVVTLWYRAPEIILSKSYSFGVDLFSVGCIIAEMVGRRALFKSLSDADHLKKIMQVVGVPSDMDLKDIVVTENAADDLQTAIEHAQEADKPYIVDGCTQWPVIFSDVDQSKWQPQLIGLLEILLSFNHAKRTTAIDVLAHSFYAGISDPDDEQVCEQEICWEFDSMELTKDNVRNALYRECMPPDARRDSQEIRVIRRVSISAIALTETLEGPDYFTDLYTGRSAT